MTVIITFLVGLWAGSRLERLNVAYPGAVMPILRLTLGVLVCLAMLGVIIVLW